MKSKLIFRGTCIETGETLEGSLIQFNDGFCTIQFKELPDGRGVTSPVDPNTVEFVNGEIWVEGEEQTW